MKKLFTSLLLGLAMLLGLFSSASAQQWSGTLYTDGTGGFDFVYPNGATVQRYRLDDHWYSKTASAIFNWTGTGTITAPDTEHAILALVQGTNTTFSNSNYHGATSGQKLWTHGIGAFVGRDGLSFEGWIGNSEAVVFTQNQRCMTYVKAGTVDCSIHMGTNQNQIYPGWIDAAPGFVLDKTKRYRIDLTYSNPRGGGEVRATLYQSMGGLFDSWAVVQTGGLTYDVAGFYPYTEPAKFVLARTPSSSGQSVNINSTLYWD